MSTDVTNTENSDSKPRANDESISSSTPATDNGEKAPEKNISSKGDSETVKEPYPGFFADMKRMGLTDEQARAQARKQQKQSSPVQSDRVGGAKNLYRPDGTPYAPWMAGIKENYESTVIKKRTDATGRLAMDPQRGELSGVGLTYRMMGGNLQLIWATGSEEDNRGFVVYRRQGKSDKWEKLDDYRSDPELKSKGTGGNSYKYFVENPDPGTWVYRVSDVDSNDNVADLSQILIDIESPEDTKVQKIALVGLLAALAVAAIIGLSLDPQS